MDGALLVFNSRAGLHRAGCSEGAILRYLEDLGWSVKSLACRGNDTIQRIRSELAASSYALVVGAGGDGTLNLIANALMGQNIPLAIIPCGTANDLAKTLHIPLELDGALELVKTGRVRRIDMGTVNGRYFLNVASVGLSARVAQGIRPESKRRWGRWAYVLEGIRQLRRRNTEKIDLCVANSCERLEAYQVSVANGVSFGGGWRVAEGARPDDGMLDVLVITKGSRRNRLRNKPAKFRPTAVERMADRTYRLSELEIYAKHSLMTNLDGEASYIRPPMRFGVARGALAVYVPAAA